MQQEPERRGRDRREYYRVKARIPVRQRTLHPEEVEELERDILTPHSEPDEVDPVTGVWLRRLEHKLDLVLSHLDPNAPRPLGPGDARSVEISASGMRFVVKDRAPIGTDVLLEVLLPGKAPHHVRAIARVVEHIDPRTQDDEPEAAFAFRVIGDADRECIVRFSNEVQRVRLRARSGERA